MEIIIIAQFTGRSAVWFSASEWGSEGRRFESFRPDQENTTTQEFFLLSCFYWLQPELQPVGTDLNHSKMKDAAISMLAARTISQLLDIQ